MYNSTILYSAVYTLEAVSQGAQCTEAEVYITSVHRFWPGWSVSAAPAASLSVQLQALPSSLREDSKQIVKGYQSANWCLE